MRHKLGLGSLVCTGIGSIIGSGWLFTSYKAAKYAGSGAFFAWIIGAIIFLLLALVLAEIATLHPKRGLFTRLLTLSHNKDMGYVTGLANWLGIVAAIPTEAMATIQYLAHSSPSMNQALYYQGMLTTWGLGLVSLLVMGYALINYWGAQFLAKSNNVVTVFKVLVPVGTALIIMWYSFHPSNIISETKQSLPNGIGGIFTAIVASGIIYAFNGFQSIVSFCAEAKDPEKNVPKALIISILLSLAIYLLLQLAFLVGMPTAYLSNGWAGLDLQSPIVQLTTILGLNYVSLILYADACVSPSGTGIIYTGTTTRMLTAMSQDKQMPGFFNRIHPIYHFSRRSLLFNTGLALSMLWFFPSWESLVIVVSLYHIVSYMACPIALMRLRLVERDRKRAFKLPLAHFICPILFVLITLLFCMSPEHNLILVTSSLTLFYGVYIVISNHASWGAMLIAVKRSYEVIVYFIVLCLLGTIGNPVSGGLDLISAKMFFVLMVVVSLAFYYRMVYGKLDLNLQSKPALPANA